MNSIKYIGMDLHSANISAAVVNDAGKLSMEATMAREASAVLDFIAGVQGTLHVTFEEGIHATWLHDLLLPTSPRFWSVIPGNCRAARERRRTIRTTPSSWPNGCGWAF